MPTDFEKKAVNGQATGFMMVKSADVKTSKRGPYLDMTLSDKGGDINAKIWDYSADRHGEYSVGEIIKVKGSIDMWGNSPQLKIERIRLAIDSDGVSPDDFLTTAQFSGKEMLEELRSTVNGFSDRDLSRLVNKLLDDCGEKLLICSAAMKMHHAIRGGLLFHTLSMLRTAKAICSVYPFLNSDLVYTGVIIHDLWKLNELSFSESGLATEYTGKGNLIGHIVGGVINIAKTGELLNIPEEKLTLVEHTVLSHHGSTDFGSPVLPMFPEALVVSFVDNLDADLYQMQQALSGVEKGQCTNRVFGLDRKLYRHSDDTEYYLEGNKNV